MIVLLLRLISAQTAHVCPTPPKILAHFRVLQPGENWRFHYDHRYVLHGGYDTTWRGKERYPTKVSTALSSALDFEIIVNRPLSVLSLVSTLEFSVKIVS